MSALVAIERLAIVPVIAIDDADRALGLADALLEGGLAVVEITFRTEAAARSIAAITGSRPEMAVGAGTILNRSSLEAAISAGASFGLAPGFDPGLGAAAQELKFPFAPGIMTPSDLTAALGMGFRHLKFFPAVSAGGAAMLEAISAPFAHLEPRFIPTGGIGVQDLAVWLKLRSVAAIGGSWIATRSDIAEGRWSDISRKARAAVDAAAKARKSE